MRPEVRRALTRGRTWPTSIGVGLALAMAPGCREDVPTPTAALDWDAKAAPAERAPDTTTSPIAAAPLDLRSLDLETAPAAGAEPGDWVRCLGGTVNDGARRFEVCQGGSQTWVDATREEVTIVAEAEHAKALAVLDQEVRFVDGRARVTVDLRRFMANVRADRVVTETALHVPIAITHEQGIARGELHLVTPRVLTLLYGVETRPLRFAGDDARPLPEAPAIMLLERDGAGVRHAPEVALSSIDVVAIDRGTIEVLAPCEGSTEARATRPVELVVIERRTARRLGERRWAGDIPVCVSGGGGEEKVLGQAGAGDPVRASGPTTEQLLEAVGAVLSEARARGGEPDR